MTFTPDQRLQMAISELILQVVDSQDEMDRSDVQGYADATAQKIIRMVKEAVA